MLKRARASRRHSSAHTATLECGTLLDYEAAAIVPDRGELVPCRHHRYCVTEEVTRVVGWTRADRPRACPRAQQDLLEWLSQRPETTMNALRRQRFTHRILAAAERYGHIAVDLKTGRVVLSTHQRSG